VVTRFEVWIDKQCIMYVCMCLCNWSHGSHFIYVFIFRII
jgi:hypothetical protein